MGFLCLYFPPPELFSVSQIYFGLCAVCHSFFSSFTSAPWHTLITSAQKAMLMYLYELSSDLQLIKWLRLDLLSCFIVVLKCTDNCWGHNPHSIYHFHSVISCFLLHIRSDLTRGLLTLFWHFMGLGQKLFPKRWNQPLREYSKAFGDLLYQITVTSW